MKIQEAFDKIVEHLAQQKTRSMRFKNQCAYRGDNNTSCAVGCLMSDELAQRCDDKIGTTSINDVWDMARDELQLEGLSESRATDFYGMMQSAHDYYDSDAERLRVALRDVAEVYGLDASKVELITEWKP